MVFTETSSSAGRQSRETSALLFALERPGANGDSGGSDRIELQNVQGRFPYPDFTAQYHYGESWGHVQLSGIVRYIGWTDTLRDAYDLWGTRSAGA